MAIRYHIGKGEFRKRDIMNSEKWTTNQRSKNATYKVKEVKLTKEFLNHLCSLAEPNYKSSYVDYDRILSEAKENKKGL